MTGRVRIGWLAVAGLAVATRLLDALRGPVLRGFDAVGHVSYVFFFDLYRSFPYANQGWSYFHPPLHYALAWPLTWPGSPELFVRGLSLWNAAASLGVAALAAIAVRLGLPGRPGLALLAFAGVAFLPPHLYTIPGPGNELTATLFGVAAVVNHLANARRAEPSLGRDAATGLLAGAALLAKYSALIPLAAIAAQLALRALRPGAVGPAAGRAALRLALVAGVAALVASPYYARNAAELGTPFALKSHPAVVAFESAQPPGERSWRDLVSVSPRLFVDPSPLAPHMVRSIWGSFYAGTWLRLDRGGPALPMGVARTLLVLGLAPTLLALAGLALSLRSAWREPAAEIEQTLVLLTGSGLAAFLVFVFGTPTFAAIKPAYLLSLSPAYGFFLARGAAGLAGQAWLQRVAIAGVGVSAAASAFAFTAPPAEESVQMAFVREYFGDHAGAEALYRRELERSLSPAWQGERLNPFWARGMVAGTALTAGRSGEARELYRESYLARPVDPNASGARSRGSPWTVNRLAVATALAGDVREARRLLDAALEGGPLAELLVNRAALRARGGELDAAEVELRQALALVPGLAPALHNLAWLHERRGEAADDAWREALAAARRAPRGYPYGVGDGRGLNTQIWMLVLEGDGLALYRPARARGAGAAGREG